MDSFTTKSTSMHSADVEEPIIIEETQTTRRVFFATINNTKTAQGETVSGDIVHQRKGQNDDWENISELKLSQLKSGDGIKIHFNSKQIKRLYEGFSKLYKLSSKGIQFGENEWTVAEAGKILEIPQNRIEFIKELLNKDYGEEVWEQLINNNPNLATKLSLSRINHERSVSLEEFENNIEKSYEEIYWQTYFENNQWIFGYGLKYKFLEIIESQPYYGGYNVSGSGGQKGDFLTASKANTRYTVLVEIKKPITKIFKMHNQEIKKYRNGACHLSDELIGAVSQLQINSRSWGKESLNPDNIDKFEKNLIYTINPKGILVIGNTKEFSNDRDARNTFESFRNSISGIEILAFDELLERARFIVGEFAEEIKEKDNDVIDTYF